MLNTNTPTQVRRISAGVCVCTAPAAVVVLLGCAGGLLAGRPHLVMMVYLLLLSLSLGSAVVAAVAHMQLTVQRSFVAGMRAGQVKTTPQDGRPAPLRVVD